MRILLSAILVLLLVPEWSTVPQLPLLGRTARITTSRVALDDDDPSRQRVGQLYWLGGVRLTSSDPAFGGFSSMTVIGDSFTLLSDGGNFARFRMDSTGRIAAPSFGNLPDGPGTGWEKRDRDSESMTIDPATGQRWIGFERYNAIWRYDANLARAERYAEPRSMAGWPINGGAEAMARLHDGHFVVISETGRSPLHHHSRAAIWFDRDPTRDFKSGFRFAYRPPAGYDPSDMAELPDGDLLVLNRRFALPYNFTAKLTIVKRADIAPGALVKGREVATFAAPLIHDNFEAVAVTREGAATIVWIASDDNQSVLQRSLLLKFRLEPEAGAPAAAD